MKRIGIVLISALVAAVAGFALVHNRHATRAAALERADGSDLEWLRTEFRLDDEQFAAVRKLHEDYSVVCGRHCAEIAAAQEQLRAKIAAGAPHEALEKARREVASLEEVCNSATREHIRRVAGCMDPEQGPRFIALVEPHLADSPHDGSRGLRH